MWNLYDGLEGSFVHTFMHFPQIQEHSISGTILKPKIKDKKITNLLTKYFNSAVKARNPRSMDRYAKKLDSMGVPLPINNLSIEKIYDVYYPIYTAIIDEYGSQRILAVDPFLSTINEKVNNILTRNIGYVKNSQSHKM